MAIAVLLAMPLVLFVLSTPAAGEAPTLTVASPLPGQVVEGDVLFAGTAADADENLRRVEIDIGDGDSFTVSLPDGEPSDTWEREWDSTNVADGTWEVSVRARDRDGEYSQYVNFTLLVDNEKEPELEDTGLLFNLDGVGEPSPWENRSAVPTTRLTFELRFSEEMDETSVRNAVRFLGGESSWDLWSANGVVYQINVSYLAAGTDYDFVLLTRAEDVAGNPLVAGYALSFRTSELATPGTPARPLLGGFALPVDTLWLWVSGVALAVAISGALAWRRGLLARLATRLRRRPGNRE